jgi:hypothetical protein
MTGLAAALGIQALTLGARSPGALAAVAFLAGAAGGIRSQVAWLTVPLLFAKVLVNVGADAAAPTDATMNARRRRSWARPAAAAALAYVGGVLSWLVPLVAISGGPAAYWRALSSQGAEDLGNITMLWTTHDPRTIAEALYYALVAPWATWPVAAIVLTCAVVGIARLAVSNRPRLALVAAAFAPYFAFDLLFQETFTGRYALPLVVPVAYLAQAGTRWLPASGGLMVLVAVAMFDAHVGGTSIAAYSREKAPAFRLLDDMAAASQGGTPPILAMDRRNAFDFRRPLAWAGNPAAAWRQLPAPPQHEWLEAMRYWNSGGSSPLWFVVDPKRTSIDLVQHGRPAQYRWPLPYPVLVSGARPNEMDWYRVDQPEWYVGEGWSLTPESAGVADADRRGLAYGPIHAGVARATNAGMLMIGGRSFDAAARPRLTVTIDGAPIFDEALAPGPFLRFVRRLPDPIEPRSPYAALTIAASPPAPVAIEQFDTSARRPLLGFGTGWHEQEFNPRTGVRWRWLSERGELKVAAVATGRGVGAGPADVLHVEGESPRTYFSKPSRLKVTSGTRVYIDRVLGDDFAFDVPLETETDTIVFETDQVYVPAERSRRSQDRRHLGLRILRCELR